MKPFIGKLTRERLTFTKDHYNNYMVTIHGPTSGRVLRWLDEIITKSQKYEQEKNIISTYKNHHKLSQVSWGHLSCQV